MSAPAPLRPPAKRSRREQDERALQMVRLRAAGRSTTEVGRVLGIPQTSACAITNAVKKADLAHPDPTATPVTIAGAHW